MLSLFSIYFYKCQLGNLFFLIYQQLHVNFSLDLVKRCINLSPKILVVLLILLYPTFIKLKNKNKQQTYNSLKENKFGN